MSKTYFAADGNYGDAEGLVILDTTGWTPDHWGYIAMLSDGQRAEVGEDLAAGRGSIDQQDCPFIYEDAEFDGACEWSGYVYRHFEYPEQGADGGYTWTCPRCDTEHNYEGE